MENEKRETTPTQKVINEQSLALDNNPPAKSPLEEVIDPTPEPTLYDANKQQSVSYKITDTNQEYHITQLFASLEKNDDVLAEYDRLRSILIDQDGDETDILTDGRDSTDYFFDEMCIDIEGYAEGEKPSDWKEQVPSAEKVKGVSTILQVRTKPIKGTKKLAKRSWGQVSSSKTIELISYFDGEAVETKIMLAEKPADQGKYDVIKSRLKLTNEGLDDTLPLKA